MKLRLLLWPDCNRSCEGCCNKQWDLNALPECTNFTGYDEIILTGGEPLLHPRRVIDTVFAIRKQAPCTPIYLYTAWSKDITTILMVLGFVDGITLTLHRAFDVPNFRNFDSWFDTHPNFAKAKSLRLHVFEEVGVKLRSQHWDVTNDIKWIPNCPLPKDEVFMRLCPRVR